MSKLQDRDVESLIAPLLGLHCQSASTSTYGALQLGFGKCHSVILAGKLHKDRYEWEIGSYTSIWSYVANGEVLCSGRSSPRNAAIPLLQEVVRIASVHSNGAVVTLGLADPNGRMIFDGTSVIDDEVIYVHGPDISIFFHPGRGWHAG